MGKKDLMGKTFGRLTVLEDTGKRTKSGLVIWKCQCSCPEHNIVEVPSSSLIRGGTKSCGCLHKESARRQGLHKKEDLTGRKFGKLIVLKDSGKRKGNSVIWRCQCTCSNHTVVDVSAGNLRSGHTKSCGCMVGHHSNFKAGDKVGKLTIIKDTLERTNNKDIIWECVCDCGNLNHVKVTSIYLSSSPYPSCGCASNSCGESKIQDCLIRMSMPFQKEYRFLDCVNPKTNYVLPFDFYLPELNLCIEYDGEQHFKERLNGFYTKEKLKELKERDDIKNDYCKKHKIDLVRISYLDFDKINEEYLSEMIFHGERKTI